VSGLGPAYRRLWTSSAASNLGDGVFQVALPLLAVTLTDSPGAIAGVALAARLPWMIFALHAGALADRLDRRRTMLAVTALRVGVLSVLAGLAAVDTASLAALYAAAFVLGVGETLFDTSAQALMPSLVRREDLSRANGRLYGVEILANGFVGPPLGGALAGASLALALAGSASAYVLAGLALATLHGAFRAPRHGPPRRIRAEIAEGLGYVWRHRLLRTLALLLGASNMLSTAVMAVFVLYAIDPGPMGLSEPGYGLLLAAVAVGGTAGSLLAPRLTGALGRARTLQIAILGFATMFGVPALTARPLLVGAAFAAGGGLMLAWNVVTVSLRQAVIPDHLLGRANAAYRLLGWGAMPVGAALGGVLGELVGLRGTFAVASAATAALVVPCRLVVTDARMIAAEQEAEDRLGGAADQMT
jgi:MFS family permease